MCEPPAETKDTLEQPGGRQASKGISSEGLFGDQKEIIIIHAGDVYRLRITARNKLILTK